MAQQESFGDVQVGVIHPGQMGMSIAAALKTQTAQVNWASADRSSASIQRAEQAGLHDLTSLAALCQACSFLFSVCPPEHAVTMAEQVAGLSYRGVYVDCNAVSPGSSQAIDEIFSGSEVAYVDGGIIGPPAVKAGTTRLYLSGQKAPVVESLFAGSVVDAIALDQRIGSASALKMAYAGWTKGSAALLMAQFALAQQQNVADALLSEWAISIPGLEDQLQSAAMGNAPKAWRFVGEMNEIAQTLEEAGLSRLWFDGAADTYQRLAHFKGRQQFDANAVITALLQTDD